LAVAALVLGILGVLNALLAVFPPCAILAVIFGVVALVLGIMSRKQMSLQGQPTGMATAGLVLGIVSTAIGALLGIACAVCFAKVNKAGSEFGKAMDEAIKKGQEEEAKKKIDPANAIRLTPKQLADQFADNSLAAAAKYRDKTVELSGPVDEISSDLFGDYVAFATALPPPNNQLRVYFDDTNAKKLPGLHKGAKITVLGIVDPLLDTPRLRKAQLK
jgi:MFS superfamily sulfate permease-like transporter